MASAHAHGRVFIHPNFAPTQIAVLFQRKTTSEDEASKIVNILGKEGGARLDISVLEDRDAINRQRKKLLQRGTPLVVVVQDKRDADDLYNFILIRGDTLQEAKFSASEIDAQVRECLINALSEIGQDAAATMQDYIQSRVATRQDYSLGNLDEDGDMARIIPLELEEGPVRKIEMTVKGEIIGFIGDADPRPCLVTSRPTKTRAILCRRF
jgi:hypothetical protein